MLKDTHDSEMTVETLNTANRTKGKDWSDNLEEKFMKAIEIVKKKKFNGLSLIRFWCLSLKRVDH